MPSAASHPPGTVLSLERDTADLLRLRIARPSDFNYAPGQSVRLEIEGVRRRYTMVSAPHEPHLEFFVELVPGGPMSRRWAALKPGDRVSVVGGSKGGISLDDRARRHLMLATVTGVNPFVSILRDAVHRGRRDLDAVLVHGASRADEFGYRDELEALAAARPDLLVYIPTVSRPADPRNADWQGAVGRADAHLGDLASRFRLSPAETTVYACGNPGMVDAVREKAGAKGYSVRHERYT